MDRVDKINRGVPTWALITAIMLAASFLRLFSLASVPFGWHPDEATKALLARDLLAGKFLPVFFSAFTGREALYVYLEAGVFTLFGEGIFAARILSAFAGTVTVALSYVAGRRLFNRRVGLFAAIFLATSLWHLIASRNGYRAVIQPLVQLPVIILLLRGFAEPERPSRSTFAWAGFWLGITQYTYTAARFFPMLVVAIIAWTAVTKRQMVWQRRRGILLMGLVAGIVFLPLGLHFIENPIDFYGRAAQVSVFSAEWSGDAPLTRLWQSIKETARMFTLWGDINYRFNVGGQPVFGVLDGLLFYGGLLVVLVRLVRIRGLAQVHHGTAVLWLGIMLLPMTLSAESLPYYQRAIGVLPVVYFFPAVATDRLLDLARRRRLKGAGGHRLFLATVAIAMLLGLGGRVFVDYFEVWHTAERNDDDRRAAMVYVADYLKETDAPAPLYLSTQYLQHPTLAMLAPEQYDRVRWFDARQSFPISPEGSEGTYLLLRENPAQPLLLQAVPGLERQHTGYDRFGRPVFDVYHLPSGNWPVAQDRSPATWSREVSFADKGSDDRQAIALPVNFGDVLAFRGHNRGPLNVEPGQVLEIVLFWEILQRPPRHYTFFVHVLDASSQVVAGYDANSYPTPFWREEGGELLLSYFPLQLPAELSAGEYQVEIGVYHQPSGERLPVLENGEVVADRLLLAPIDIEPR